MKNRSKTFSAVAIVPARDEEGRIGRVIAQLHRLHLNEIIVVANGCHDRTAEVAKYNGARVIAYEEPLGHDVARAIGAAIAEADAYLFTDGDLICTTEELFPFIQAVASGVDVALNDLNSIMNLRSKIHVANIAKAYLNYAMGMAALGINSLTAAPHCLSRKAVEVIGSQNLMVPPVALYRAQKAGLVIQPVAGIDVVTRNRFKGHVHESLGHMDSLIIGDHLEALAELIQDRGERGPFPEDRRNREVFLQALEAQASDHIGGDLSGKS